MNLATVISLVIFGITMLTLAGSYGYQYVLLNQINKECDANGENCGLRHQLDRERANINMAEINRLKKLDLKLNRAESIISSHTSLIPLLSLFETNTVHSVRFDSIDFTNNQLEMIGEAENYESIAVFANLLRDTNRFNQVSFSNFKINQNDDIDFNLSAEVKRDLLLERQ